MGTLLRSIPLHLIMGAHLRWGKPKNTSEGKFGPCITWVQDDPISFLESQPTSEPAFDLVIFAHSLWYFSSPSQIQSTLAAAAKHTSRIVVAEYNLHASGRSAVPHVYATFARAALEVHKPTSISNVRTVIGPWAITTLAAKANLRVVRESIFTPEEYVKDARLEAEIVSSRRFEEEVETVLVEHERERGLVLALRECMITSIDRDVPGGGRGIRTMDVWCAVLEPQMT